MEAIVRKIRHQLQQKRQKIATCKRQIETLLKEQEELEQALQLLDQNIRMKSKRDETPASSTPAKRQRLQLQQRDRNFNHNNETDYY
nr:hypothetical protein [Tanacetum cinerariifolium]